MTLEEAIKHCEEVADHCRWEGLTAQQRERKQKCAEEHLQFANWLKELKEYREKENFLKVRMAEFQRGFEQLGVEWARIKDNPPLTWEELKKLNDKPIWIYEYSEFFNKWMGEWAIIYSIEEYWDGSKTLYTKEDAVYEFENMGTKWKAYKKEKIQNQ